MTRKLRLTPFERCMFYDDRPGYPNYAFVKTRFTGILDRKVFTAAVNSVLPNHPLFTATVQIESREYWVFSTDISPKLIYIDKEPDANFPAAEKIDLKTDSGLVIFIVQGASTFDLTFQFHHACCDGAGLRQFIFYLFHSYAQQSGNADQITGKTRTRASRLYNRERQSMGQTQQQKGVKDYLTEAVYVFKYLIRKAKPVARPQPTASQKLTHPGFPASVRLQLTREEHASLSSYADSNDVNVNGLLLSHFFQTLWTWQKAIGQHRPRDWLRIAVPFDIRDHSHRSLPAVNQVSLLFIDRRAIDYKSTESFLRGIHDEIQHIQRHKIQFTFLKTLSYLDKVPALLKYLVQKQKCTSSAAFSNMGKLFVGKLADKNGMFQMNDLTLTDIQGLAPVRIYNGVSVLLIEYAGTLSINFHYDQKIHTQAEVEQLTELFAQSLPRSQVQQKADVPTSAADQASTR